MLCVVSIAIQKFPSAGFRSYTIRGGQPSFLAGCQGGLLAHAGGLRDADELVAIIIVEKDSARSWRSRENQQWRHPTYTPRSSPQAVGRVGSHRRFGRGNAGKMISRGWDPQGVKGAITLLDAKTSLQQTSVLFH